MADERDSTLSFPGMYISAWECFFPAPLLGLRLLLPMGISVLMRSLLGVLLAECLPDLLPLTEPLDNLRWCLPIGVACLLFTIGTPCLVLLLGVEGSCVDWILAGVLGPG